ncbi:DUF7344 domain-containing protein [Halalkalirubrum salinum]|uniref:DUF7344 domain-containing protein n=1 Tax=Halalkalirubrum salinum TaxID=2563889 RepID=UPI0010FBBC4C|nr:hypothetical protein [Halalkalirubrum salinum]
MPQNNPSQSNHIDKLLHVLADPHCRTTLSYLQHSSDSVVSVQDLTDEISTDGHGDTTQLRIKLHHSTLPRLADTGVLEYDPTDHTVRYHGHPQLEPLMNSISESSPETID